MSEGGTIVRVVAMPAWPPLLPILGRCTNLGWLGGFGAVAGTVVIGPNGIDLALPRAAPPAVPVVRLVTNAGQRCAGPLHPGSRGEP